MKKFVMVVVVLLLLGIFCITGYTDGYIQGKVVNKRTNTPIMRAMVQFKNTVTGAVSKAYTGSDGNYKSDKLLNGTYNVACSKSGFYTARSLGVKIWTGGVCSYCHADVKDLSGDNIELSVPSSPRQYSLVNIKFSLQPK